MQPAMTDSRDAEGSGNGLVVTKNTLTCDAVCINLSML